MTVKEAINERRSIRKFIDRKIEKEVLIELIEAARLAPSSKNRQPWKFIVCTGNSKARLVQAMESGIKREFIKGCRIPAFRFGLADAKNTCSVMKQAPVVILILNTEDAPLYEEVNAEKRINEICNTLSIGAAVEHIVLAAQEKGIGSLWVANTCFAYEEIEDFLETKKQIAGLLVLGYYEENPFARPRKSLEEIVEFLEA
ncbi:MAG: nitroreductase family protein [Treponema sp.]|nr:nitroreductase family protein [Candidatus Treponema equifaecale]